MAAGIAANIAVQAARADYIAVQAAMADVVALHLSANAGMLLATWSAAATGPRACHTRRANQVKSTQLNSTQLNSTQLKSSQVKSTQVKSFHHPWPRPRTSRARSFVSIHPIYIFM